MLTARRALAVVTVLAISAACSGDDSASTSPVPGALSGRDAIRATQSEGAAQFGVREGPIDRAADRETSAVDTTLEVDAWFDFVRNRALARWQFPPVLDGEATDVEVRTIGGTSYIKDGSWLCPGCGLDGDEPLPDDKWITFTEDDVDVGFTFGTTFLRGYFGWLALVEEAVEPTGFAELEDGTPVWTYRAKIPVDDVNAAVKAADPDNPFAPSYEGEPVAVTFRVDEQRRLHQLVAAYRVEGRARMMTATLTQYGELIEIDTPPAAETISS